MIRGAGPTAVAEILQGEAVDDGLFAAALEVKRRAGEINVIIHAVGILLTLPYVLDPDEHVQSSSLGAGSGGHAYDLETDRRLAEFKFTTWRGNDAVRQRELFADFVNLAEASGDKRRQLFVARAELPKKFLYQSRRTLRSVCDRRPETLKRIADGHHPVPETVSEYTRFFGSRVELVDLATFLPSYLVEEIAVADDG